MQDRKSVGPLDVAFAGLVAAYCICGNALATAYVEPLSADNLGPLALAYHDSRPPLFLLPLLLLLLLVCPVLPLVGRGALIAFVGAACANIGKCGVLADRRTRLHRVPQRRCDRQRLRSRHGRVGGSRCRGDARATRASEVMPERPLRADREGRFRSGSVDAGDFLGAVSRRWMRQSIWDAIFSIRSSILSRISVGGAPTPRSGSSALMPRRRGSESAVPRQRRQALAHRSRWPRRAARRAR